MTKKTTQKIYCYVDETGQDAASSMFVVVAVVSEQEQEEIRETLTAIEDLAHTNHLKWHKTSASRALKYLKLVLAKDLAHVFYGSFQKPIPFFFPMIEVIESAVKAVAKAPYKARIFVDGIDPKKAAELTNALRARGVSLEMVRSRRDESEPLIRLADMWAGCIRAALSGKVEEGAVLDEAVGQSRVRDVQEKTP